jgi:hypothetical protein
MSNDLETDRKRNLPDDIHYFIYPKGITKNVKGPLMYTEIESSTIPVQVVNYIYIFKQVHFNLTHIYL